MISIHALLAESDGYIIASTFKRYVFQSTLSLRRATRGPGCGGPAGPISIHALLAESDITTLHVSHGEGQFQSTLSLRRATRALRVVDIPLDDFNPRSPCGERLAVNIRGRAAGSISIHALLAESDEFFSNIIQSVAISIHALLAESDRRFLDS